MTQLFLSQFESPNDMLDNIPVKELTIFAQDVHESFFFGWLKSQKDDYSIYCIDHTRKKKTKPPRVAKTFTQFVDKVCLGTLMHDLGLQRTQSDEVDDSSSDEEAHLPPKSFKPFAGKN